MLYQLAKSRKKKSKSLKFNKAQQASKIRQNNQNR